MSNILNHGEDDMNSTWKVSTSFRQNNPDTNISMALVFHDGHSPYITCFTIPKRVAMKHEAHAEKY